MVRKRGRGRGSAAGFRRRSSRTFDGSDDNESDIDLNLESPPASPEGSRRYGLRQRSKRPILTDYYYDDDDETIPTKDESDDDQDYNVAEDISEKKRRISEKSSNSSYCEKRGRFIVQIKTSENSIKSPVTLTENPSKEDVQLVVQAKANDPNELSQEATRPEAHDGPVDFEDIIRADVVNKQKPDYDNVVNKTEIQVEPLPLLKISKVQKVKSSSGRRRGRKSKDPKSQEPEYHITADYSVDNIININGDSNEPMEVQLDPLEMLQTEYLDDPRGNKSKSPKENGVSKENEEKIENNVDPVDSNKPNGVKVPITIKPMDRPEVQKPPDFDPKEKEVILSNEYLLANAFDYSAEEFVKKQEEDKNKPLQEEEQPVQQLIFDSDDDSDDDVIIIEKKPEIIVLDDD